MSHSSNPNAADGKPKPIPKVRTWFWRSFPRISDDIQRGFEQYGDLIQLKGIFLRVYCLRDPSQIEQVLRHPKVGITKLPSVLPRLKSMMPSSTVVVAGGDEWRHCQDVMKAMFGNEYMRRYSAITAELTQHTLDGPWKQYAADGRTFDIYEETQFLLTRLAARLLFSKELPDDQIVDISRKNSFLESQFSKRLPPVLPTAADSRYRRNMSEYRQMMRELLHERRATTNRQLDLLQILSDQGNSVTEDWIIDHMIEMWNSVRLVNPPTGLAFHLIAQHPEVQEKLADEIAQSELEPSPDFDNTRTLTYLNMVLAESLRFYPSILLLPRWCADGMLIDGHKIPPKSLVVPMIYHTHRNSNIFANPMAFDPARWSPERQQEIHSHARLAFGAGQRGCLGIKLAKDIMRTVIASVFQRYRLEETEASQPATNVELTVHPTKPIRMRLRFAASADLSGSLPRVDTGQPQTQPA